MKSPFLQEFEARGFLAQCTHLQELDELMIKESVTAYIGFDCTAKSLHAGSLIQIMILRLLQKHGHKPLVLLGGGTTKIGDPSGKDAARKVLSEADILDNLNGIRQTLQKFIRFDEANSGAVLVNNNDWLKEINYIDFLRDIGRHFSINRMLTFDSVKTRLEREQPLSFLEFNYMILQAYDFYELNKKYNCRLQLGGSDQWGNIVNGVELTRRINSDFSSQLLGKHQAFGLTSPLLTTADGKKMGKTADGAIWLDSEMLSPFDYFQYFRNTDDRDVGKFLKLFTDLDLAEIATLTGECHPALVAGSTMDAALQRHDKQGVAAEVKTFNINQAKERLAFEATKICHGEKIAEEVLQKAREIFVSKNAAALKRRKLLC